MLKNVMGNKTALRGLIALVVALTISMIAYLAHDIRGQMRMLATASSDNVQWTLTQAEVEAKSLEIEAKSQSLAVKPDLAAVRLRFDILYSRMDTLSAGTLYEVLRDDPRVTDSLREIDIFFERMIPLIDGPDAALAEALPVLTEAARDAKTHIRHTSIVGIDVFSRLSEERRASVATTLISIAMLTLALLLGLIVLIYVLVRMVRRERETTERSRQMRDRMQTILSTSLDAIVVSDSDGRVLEYNGAAEKTFGHSSAEAIGADMADLIIPDGMREMHRKGMERYRKTGRTHVIGKGIMQLEAKRSTGEVFPVDLSLSRAAAPEGEIFIAFIRDISDRVRAEAEITQARDRAVAGEKSKAELLAVMSHEMRTPLNGILGTLELIDTAALDTRHRQYMRIIRKSGQTLLGHVNDVLEISRLDAGKLSVNRRRFDLIELVGETLETLLGAARENGNRLHFAPPHPALHEAWGDPDRIRQILLNLVGNAIKFTRNGVVTVETECDSGLSEVEIRVIDTGIGIAPENIGRIFGDFVTIDTTYGRSAGGTGLGLGISQRLATVMGGEIGVESEPGDGSVFWLRLPLAPPAGPPLPESPEDDTVLDWDVEVAEASGSRPLNVLLVEDNFTNRLVARTMLERDGHTVFEAHDGEEGVLAARSGRFDVILMDISMPGMDGVEATRHIRGAEEPDAHVPIIAATAHTMPSEIERFRAAGMDEILVKPLNMAALRHSLSAALETAARLSRAPAERAMDDPHDRADIEAVIPEPAAVGRRPDAVPAAPAARDLPLIDAEQVAMLAEMLPGPRLDATLTTFAAEMDGFVSLRAADPVDPVDPAQFPALAAETHRLAGSAAVFGALRLNGLLLAIEQAAKGEDPGTVQARLSDMRPCWSETRDSLDQRLAVLRSGAV